MLKDDLIKMMKKKYENEEWMKMKYEIINIFYKLYSTK